MRRVKIFSGSSHPALVEAICDRLGTPAAKCELKKFSNGETSVNINTSIRDQDVFIVQSGSPKINDSVMEMLIMISACKGGSAKSITAVMPYFPYSRQSKKKSHRGAITARLLANLLAVAGIHHVITVDLHAPPTQGFFGKPVDNLHAEPLIARWITTNVSGWKDAVVVSKNPGGTKRVTSLADALKLNFGLVTTDRRRTSPSRSETNGFYDSLAERRTGSAAIPEDKGIQLPNGIPDGLSAQHSNPQLPTPHTNVSAAPARPINTPRGPSPLYQSTRIESASPPMSRALLQAQGEPEMNRFLRAPGSGEDSADEYTDERAREVITGRLIHGHIVDDDAPSPNLSAMTASFSTLPGASGLPSGLGSPSLEERDPMTLSFMSTASRLTSEHGLVGSNDPTSHSDDEEERFKDPELEHTITLVGNVRDKVVLIMDDLIDQAGSWIAAAETVVKKGGAEKVYCIATHGLFGDDSLEQMEACECIDYVVVTNTYPIAPERIKACKKLVVLDISNLLAEAIRRNHYGESISALYQTYQD